MPQASLTATKKRRLRPLLRRPVYVVGAGFSAGLGYPLVNDLLIRLWPRLPEPERVDLRKVIAFHHPGFDPDRATSFPNVETLLSEMMANEQLFDASRAAPGGFTLEQLQGIRQTLLLGVADWFHEIYDKSAASPPSWLTKFAEKVIAERAAIISFNWDLVLDQRLFGNGIKPSSYGFARTRPSGAMLLKPHGSLNWYLGKRIKEAHRELLHANGDEEVYRFTHFRAPTGKRNHTPLIIPPVFNKTFSQSIFSDLWRRCVSVLSTASKVTFLGYSLPEADLHARFILRCGFYNQGEGELTPSGRRAPAGSSKVTIVNPDLGAARRIEGALGPISRCEWMPMIAQDWCEEKFL